MTLIRDAVIRVRTEQVKEIRDDELYKEDGFETWEKYCRERWELSKQHVWRLITSAEYRERLPSISKLETNGKKALCAS